MPEIASAHKIAYHREKLEAYLRNERILPATLELDISTECNRKCPLCPSTTSPRSSTLSLGFIERLFTRLEGQTAGLLLSGGEPTLAPIFPEVLRLAREHGFVDIAVVTNGSLLDKERVAAALCEYASTIRVSVYDWTGERRADQQATLRRIEGLEVTDRTRGQQPADWRELADIQGKRRCPALHHPGDRFCRSPLDLLPSHVYPMGHGSSRTRRPIRSVG